MAAAPVGGSSLLAVWFSKDRALQLSEALRTFTHFAEPPQQGLTRHVVLYACSSSAHARSYAQLASALPSVAFVDEMSAPGPSSTPSHSLPRSAPPATAHSSSSGPGEPSEAAPQSHFASHLLGIVAGSCEQFVLLCVDDALFVSRFSLPHIFRLFASPELLSYHLALHPGLTFHHPSSSPLTVPQLASPPASAASAASAASEPAQSSPCPSLVFAHSSGAGSHDFRYPFSLAATVYRLADVRSIVAALWRSSALPCHHPNLLESSGNAFIATGRSIPPAVRAFLPPPSPSDASNLSSLRPLSGLPSRPLCVVVTVNRVQAVYRNAVYDSADGGVAALLRRFECGGWQLDEARYGQMAAQGRFNSVHVGELLWKRVEVDRQL